MVGGVAGEDVGQAGFDAHAADGELAALAPVVGRGELHVAELDAAPLVRPVRVGDGHVHRHVDVRTPVAKQRRTTTG